MSKNHIASGHRLPKSAPSALYQQVRNYIDDKITSKEWVAGDRVPSEHELVAQFGISRMTVNRALRELAEEGRVVRVAGVGTFVAEERPQSTLLQIANIAEDIRQRGHRYRCKILSVELVPATPEVASAMGLHTGQQVAHSRCIHFENDVAVQFEDRFVNPRMAPDFARQTFAAETPAAYLLRAVPVQEIEHVVEATLPNKRQAALLQMEETQPCLVLFRRTWTDQTVVTMVRCYHPASRYRLGSRFPVNGAGR